MTVDSFSVRDTAVFPVKLFREGFTLYKDAILMWKRTKFHRAAVVLRTIKRNCIAYKRLEAYC